MIATIAAIVWKPGLREINSIVLYTNMGAMETTYMMTNKENLGHFVIII